MPRPPRESPNPETAERQVRVQTRGVRILQCRCGAISKHTVHPQQHRLRCGTCKRVWMVGNLIMEIPPGAHVGRDPADAAITGRSEEEHPYPAGLGDEPSMPGGYWRSREPVNLDMPVELRQLWVEVSSERLAVARSAAFGTRYVYAYLDAPDARLIQGAREFLKAFKRLD